MLAIIHLQNTKALRPAFTSTKGLRLLTRPPHVYLRRSPSSPQPHTRFHTTAQHGKDPRIDAETPTTEKKTTKQGSDTIERTSWIVVIFAMAIGWATFKFGGKIQQLDATQKGMIEHLNKKAVQYMEKEQDRDEKYERLQQRLQKLESSSSSSWSRGWS